MTKISFRDPDRNAVPVSHPFLSSRKSVEQGRFPRVRVAAQGDFNHALSPRSDRTSPSISRSTHRLRKRRTLCRLLRPRPSPSGRSPSATTEEHPAGNRIPPLHESRRFFYIRSVSRYMLCGRTVLYSFFPAMNEKANRSAFTVLSRARERPRRRAPNRYYPWRLLHVCQERRWRIPDCRWRERANECTR